MKDSMKSSLDGDAGEASSGVAGPKYVGKYKFFRELLDHNRRALALMADLEETYYSNRPLTSQQIMAHCDTLQEEVAAIIECLKQLSGKNRPMLSSVLTSIQRSVRDDLAPKFRHATDSHVLHLEHINSDVLRSIGGKAAKSKSQNPRRGYHPERLTGSNRAWRVQSTATTACSSSSHR